VELTTLETELNSNNRKAPAVCATISFTGLVNIFVISVTTRQLVVTQPWKDEAEKVRNALGIENFADDLVANDEAALEIDQNMVVDNEIVVSNEGIVLDKESTESIYMNLQSFKNALFFPSTLLEAPTIPLRGLRM
jgi:hypothetical protein